MTGRPASGPFTRPDRFRSGRQRAATVRNPVIGRLRFSPGGVLHTREWVDARRFDDVDCTVLVLYDGGWPSAASDFEDPASTGPAPSTCSRPLWDRTSDLFGVNAVADWNRSGSSPKVQVTNSIGANVGWRASTVVLHF